MKKQNSYLPLSKSEIEMFVQHDNGKLSMEHLFLRTGIRLFELFSLFKEFNLNNDYVYIYGKGSKGRKIPFTDKTKDIIIYGRNTIKGKHLNYLDFQLNRKYKEVKLRDATDESFIIENHLSDEMVASNKKVMAFVRLVSRKFLISKEFKDKFKISFNPHRFRATFATGLIENSVDLVTIQALMGHANINQTSEYIKSSDATLRSAVHSFDNMKGYENMTRQELYNEVLKLRKRLNRVNYD